MRGTASLPNNATHRIWIPVAETRRDEKRRGDTWASIQARRVELKDGSFFSSCYIISYAIDASHTGDKQRTSSEAFLIHFTSLCAMRTLFSLSLCVYVCASCSFSSSSSSSPLKFDLFQYRFIISPVITPILLRSLLLFSSPLFLLKHNFHWHFYINTLQWSVVRRRAKRRGE